MCHSPYNFLCLPLADVFLCSWCQRVFPSKVELFQHFLVDHQGRLLAHDEYVRQGSNLQREIEDLEKKVFSFPTQKFKVRRSQRQPSPMYGRCVLLEG